MNINVRASAIPSGTEQRELYSSTACDQLVPGYVKLVTNSMDDRLVIDDGGGMVCLTLAEAKQVRDFLNRALAESPGLAAAAPSQP